mgnify:CR=1 FL=1
MTTLAPEKREAIERYLAAVEDKTVKYEEVLRSFIENFYLISHRDDARRVPMKFTPAQGAYWKRKTSRDVVTKARQVAFSSVVNAWFSADLWHTPGLWALLVTQKPEEKQIPQHQTRLKLFYNSVPDGFKPRQIRENHDRWEFAFQCQQGCYAKHPQPCGNVPTSQFWFGASGTEELAQGGTYHRIHFTEASGYDPKEAEQLRDNVAGAPLSSIIVWESRPNGADNFFHDLYQEARTKSGVYRAHFFPWHMEPYYAIDPVVLGKAPKLTEHEARLMLTLGLTMGQIAWRRLKIREMGSEERFLEQFAEDEETCFLISGKQVYDALYLRQVVDEAKPPLSATDTVRIWLPPVAGEAYCIGADPAMGHQHSDDSAAIVRKARTWEHVATVQGKIPPREFAGILSELGKKYNEAVVNVLRNDNSFGVQDLLLNGFGYENLYVHSRATAVNGDDLWGFPESRTTKAWVVGQQRTMVLDKLWKSWDKELIGQMLRFQMSMTEFGNITYGGDPDDLVSADLACLAAREQALQQGGVAFKRAATSQGGFRP